MTLNVEKQTTYVSQQEVRCQAQEIYKKMICPNILLNPKLAQLVSGR